MLYEDCHFVYAPATVVITLPTVIAIAITATTSDRAFLGSEMLDTMYVLFCFVKVFVC